MLGIRLRPIRSFRERIGTNTFDNVAAILAGITSVIAIAWLGRHSWFFGDVWDFLTRDGSFWEVLVEPHNGHLQWLAALTYRGIYAIVGMDYWPWYFLPRLLGYAAMAFVLWKVMLARGADRAIAFVGYLVLLFLGTSAFLTTAVVGNFLVVAVLVALAHRLESQEGVGWHAQLSVGLLLLLMLSSTSLGVAAFVGVSLALVVHGRLGAYWASLVGSVVPYGVWYLKYGGGSRGSPDLSFESLTALPGLTFEMFSIAVPRLFGFPRVFGPILVIGLTVGLFWLAKRSGLDLYITVLGLTALTYIAMVLLVRVVTGQIPIGAPRYGYVLTLLLVPALLPSLRIPGSVPIRASVIAFLGTVALLGNMHDLDAGLDYWEKEAADVERVVTGVAVLIARGEPYQPGARLDTQHATTLQLKDVAGFVADGWRPVMPGGTLEGEPVERIARGELRMELRKVGGQEVESADGCMEIPRGGAREISVRQAHVPHLSTSGDATITVRWHDDAGVGVLQSELSGHWRFELGEPSGGDATVTLIHEGGSDVQLCGRSR